jgi:hemerythrin-like domain-containing protein
MTGITETLIAEHAVLRNAFEFVERIDGKRHAIAEIKMVGSLVSSLLCKHAEAEDDLVLVCLDHVLAEKHIYRLHKEHQEIDARLVCVQNAHDALEGLRLLKEAVAASRAHFLYEERTLFPLVDKVLKKETLEQLNEGYRIRHQSSSSGSLKLVGGTI